MRNKTGIGIASHLMRVYGETEHGGNTDGIQPHITTTVPRGTELE